MHSIQQLIRRFDRFQQQHDVIGLPYAVLKKFGDDQAGSKAALVAYYGLFSLFPLLLVLATLLGFVLAGHPALQQHVLNTAFADFPIIGTQLKGDTHALKGSALAVVIGVIGTLYGSQGVAQAMSNAMNAIWNVPYQARPNFIGSRLRSYAWLGALGLATVATTVIAGFGTTLLHGVLGWFATTSVAFVIDLGLFYVVFAVLTVVPLGWRDVALGVVLATVFWEGLQMVGGLLVRHTLAHASNTYGFFAIVIGLLSWLALAAQLTMLAAEINVVRHYRLWPRSIVQPPLTAADRAAYTRLAQMVVRRPEMNVTVTFTPDADERAPESEPARSPLSEPAREPDHDPV